MKKLNNKLTCDGFVMTVTNYSNCLDIINLVVLILVFPPFPIQFHPNQNQ